MSAAGGRRLHCEIGFGLGGAKVQRTSAKRAYRNVSMVSGQLEVPR